MKVALKLCPWFLAVLLLLGFRQAFSASTEPVQVVESSAEKGLKRLLTILNSDDIEPGQVLTANLPTSINAEKSVVPLKQSGRLELVNILASDELSVEFELEYVESKEKLVGVLLINGEGEFETVDLRSPREDRLYLGYGVDAALSDKLLAAFPNALARYHKRGLIPLITASVKSDAAAASLKDINQGIRLAEKLTDVLQEVSGDRQLQVFFTPQTGNPLVRPAPPAPPAPPKFPVPKLDSEISRVECGFDPIVRKVGNAAYIRVRGFGIPDDCTVVIDEIAREASSSPAVILDLMNASAGHPGAAAYIASHFFNGNADFSDLYFAPTMQRLGFISRTPSMGSSMLAEQKLFVLVSGNTTQIGEALAHDLKRLGRALIIGEPTEGFSDLTVTTYLDERFGLRLPNATYITPDGEPLSGKPLIPDVPVLARQAIGKALAMANAL